MLISRSIRRVAVTGALSAGKSSVCRFFAELGAYVVSCDSIVHSLLKVPSKLTEQIVALFGEEVIVQGQLDRGCLAKRAFANCALASALEKLLHPHVRTALETAYQACVQAATYPLFVAEVPLLYEVGWEQDFDFVVAVLADSDKCRKRFRKSFFSDSPSESDRAYLQRMARQMDPKEKARRADCVLINKTTQQNLRKAVEELYVTLIRSN